MAQGLGIRVTDLTTRSTRDHIFRRLPVRIGRNGLNDLVLDEGFVSQFHAMLELTDGQLTIRDVGSTNGTAVPGIGRLVPNQAAGLKDCGFRFSIVSLGLQTYTAEVDDVPESVASPLGVTSYLRMPRDDRPLNGAGAAELRAALESQEAHYVAYRTAWQHLSDSLRDTVTRLPPGQSLDYLAAFASRFPCVTQEADYTNTLSALGHPGAAPQETMAPATAAVALQGLQQVASKLCPKLGVPESVEEVVTFLGRMDEALTVFLRSFIQLRDGQKQQAAEVALSGLRHSVHGENDGTVEGARSPEELAAVLLDWRAPGREGARALAGMYADMMIHEMAFMHGVMSGVKELLHELSPEHIERLAQKRKGSSAGLGFGLFRFANRWQEYVTRYRDIADEEKQVFALLFGKDFARAYAQFVDRDRPSAGSALSDAPPAGARAEPAASSEALVTPGAKDPCP